MQTAEMAGRIRAEQHGVGRMGILDHREDRVEGLLAAWLPALRNAIQQGEQILSPFRGLCLQDLRTRRAADRDLGFDRRSISGRYVEKGTVDWTDEVLVVHDKRRFSVVGT